MSLDARLISLVIHKPKALVELRQAGITTDHFNDDYQKVWNFILRSADDHGSVPSGDLIEGRFSFFHLEATKQRDAPSLIVEIFRRRQWQQFLHSIDEAATTADNPELLDLAISQLQEKLNDLSYGGQARSVVDVFGEEARERMLADMKERRRGGTIGIPTGLKRFDSVTGGLQHSRMVTVMARSGVGKSWLAQLFVASAVISGHKVVLFPLEMTLEETLMRLYTVFSHSLYGQKNVLKNTDLTHGRVSKEKLVRFMHLLEDKYSGQLLISDIGAMSDPYTLERVGADVAMHQPDMFWVDYLTLMSMPDRGLREDQQIGILSKGVKRLAVMHKCVGGASAQVNREAVRSGQFLPRIEHIAGGDGIGRDSDQVISANKRDDHLYYALVKNRLGPEFGNTKAIFDVDRGRIEDAPMQDDDED